MQFLRAALFFAMAGGMLYQGLTNYRNQTADIGRLNRHVVTGDEATLYGQSMMALSALVALVGLYCLICGIRGKPDFTMKKKDDWD